MPPQADNRVEFQHSILQNTQHVVRIGRYLTLVPRDGAQPVSGLIVLAVCRGKLQNLTTVRKKAVRTEKNITETLQRPNHFVKAAFLTLKKREMLTTISGVRA